jgi:prophage regulatory protein
MDFQLLNLREVRRRLPRSRSTLYSEIARGIFPKPIKAGRGSFWRDDEVEDLVAAYAGGATEPDLRALCESFYQRRQRRP